MLADRMLRSADVGLAAGPPTLAVGTDAPDALHPLRVQQWQLALTGSWSARAHAAANAALRGDDGAALRAVDVARRALADRAVRVVAPPETAAALRAELPEDLAARVLSW